MSKEHLGNSLEKVFFHYIIQNPKHFRDINSNYFKNEFISLAYTAIQKYQKDSNKQNIPSNEQLKHIIKINQSFNINNKSDENNLNERIDILLNENINNYDNKQLLDQFKAQALYHKTSEILSKSIDEFRKIKNIDQLNYDEVINLNSKIRNFNSNDNTISFDDNLGLDFDDPESHIQQLGGDKITTGYTNMDKILGGGQDRKTLNILMGMTGSGKSVQLNNFAVNAANAGYNVLYVSLEMSDRKIMKRLGSIRLGIPINMYDTVSMDEKEIKKRIAALKRDDESGLMVEKKIGKIYVKEYPISTATPDDIDSFLTQLKDIKNVNIDLLIIDYLGIMSAKGAIDSSLYNKGKFIAEGSRAIGQKRNLVVLSATQTAKDTWGAAQISLNDTPESKAIPETADTQQAIIRTPEMKAAGTYRLQALKLRDVEFYAESLDFDFDKTYLKIINDRIEQ